MATWRKVRMTDEDWKAIQRAAAVAHSTASELVRHASVGLAKRILDGHAEELPATARSADGTYAPLKPLSRGRKR